MAELSGILDLWSLLVHYIGGNFFMATLCVIILLFLICMLGRLSIYTTLWYIMFFVLAMALGYGYLTFDILLTVFMVAACAYSIKSWIDGHS